VIPPLPEGFAAQHRPCIACPCGQDLTPQPLHLGAGPGWGFVWVPGYGWSHTVTVSETHQRGKNATLIVETVFW